MVKIRLARGGAKKRPFYSIVVTDERRRRDSGYIERIGYFNPVARGAEQRLTLDTDKLTAWIEKGAKPSDRVKQLVKEYNDPSIREKIVAKRAAAIKAREEQKILAAKAELEAQAKEAAEAEAAEAEAAAAESNEEA